MDRREAMAKIKDLEAVAKSATIPGEREAAQNRADHLKAKWAVTDAEVRDLVYEEIDYGYGNRLTIFPYHNVVGPHIKMIRDSIALVQEAIENIRYLPDRLKYACKFYRDVQELFETGYFNEYSHRDGPPPNPKWPKDLYKDKANTPHTVKKWRDMYIKALYDQFMAEQMDDDDGTDIWAPLWAHHEAVRKVRSASSSDLRESTIEAAAQCHAKKLSENIARKEAERKAKQGRLEASGG
jgi:hypothetical protein